MTVLWEFRCSLLPENGHSSGIRPGRVNCSTRRGFCSLSEKVKERLAAGMSFFQKLEHVTAPLWEGERKKKKNVLNACQQGWPGSFFNKVQWERDSSERWDQRTRCSRLGQGSISHFSTCFLKYTSRRGLLSQTRKRISSRWSAHDDNADLIKT